MKNSQNSNHAKHLTSQGIHPTIGLLIAGIHRPWEGPQWHGVADAAREHEVNLITFPGEEVRCPRGFLDQANILYDLVNVNWVDGLIIWTGGFDQYLSRDEWLAFYQRFHPIPIVCAEKLIEGIPSITMDDYQAMRKLLIHLIEHHHFRRIAFLRGSDEHLGARIRYQAYVDTLTEYDLFDSALVSPAYDSWLANRTEKGIPSLPVSWGSTLTSDPWPWVAAHIVEAIRVLLDERKLHPPGELDAIVGWNDLVCIAAIRILQSRGIRVSEDVAVAGFDDIEEGRVITPPLTTVRPSSYEIGRQAVETLLALIAGNTVPEQVAVPGKVIVRQSCGCIDPIIVQVIPRVVATTGTPSRDACAAQREEIVLEMIEAIGTSLADASEWAAQLVEAFDAELGGAPQWTFVSVLHEVLRQVMANDGEVEAWQNAISVLWHRMLPIPGKEEEKVKLGMLCQQARVLIGQTARRVEGYERLNAAQQAQTLREIESALNTTVEVDALMDVLAEHLPRLEIAYCALAVYEDPQLYKYPQSAPEWARLMLAYNRQGRMTMEDGGRRFSSQQLLPQEFLPPDHPYMVVAEPLYFRENQIGFALFGVGPRDGNVYEALRSGISSALQGALLVQRVQERTAELARQQYILDTFMANVPAAIYFKDRDSRITKVNRAFAARYGLNDPSEVVGKTDFDLFPEKEARTKYEHEQEIIRTGRPMLMLEESGREGKWELTTKMPLRDEHGEIIGTFGISHDITKLKRTEAALNEAKEAALEAKNVAEAANRAKSEFLAHMSHELRTPLNGILGYTQLLKRDPGLPEKQWEAIDIIHQSGEHLLTLITDLLDLAKIEAHKMELSPKWFAFPSFLDRITGIIRMRAQEKAIAFHYAPLASLPAKVYADERRLRQVLLNLLGNAVKFTERGGMVTLKILDCRLQIADSEKNQSQISNLKSQIRFQVEDTGIGMTPDQLHRIFLPFEQVGDLQYRIVGTGLGLAISRQLVHLMDSEIQVTSTFGTGSTFWFELTLPVVMEEQEEPPVHVRTLIGYKGRRQNILIVDNDTTSRLIIRNLLEPLGFACAEAENGREALEKVHNLQPDVILIDLSMPVMSGFEAVQAIRQIPKFADMVVIAVSASAFESDEEKSRIVGCDGFVVKPVDVNRLFALLEEHLKVDWIYEEVEEGAGKERPDVPMPDQSLVPPPPEELKVLYDLALKGDIFGIQKHVAILEQRDRKFRPFAAKLSQFAKTYQDEYLLAFLESYLEEKA